MKRLIIVVPSFGAGTRISYQIPFEILAAQKLMTYRFIRECYLKLEDLQDITGLILYRCTRGNTLALARYARKKGIPVIYEIDDDFLNPPEDEPWGRQQIRCGKPQIIKMFLEASDLIKTGSPLLAERIRELGFATIYHPFAVIMRSIEPQTKQSPFRIGYFGSSHHQTDITEILPALLAVEQEFGTQVEFEFFGCAPRGWQQLKIARLWKFDYDYESFLDTLRTRRWTIGLAPLQPNRFNEAKSNSKFRDYTACGIPGIYADLAPYRDCVIQGESGLRCEVDPNKWAEAIATIIHSPEPLQMAYAAREYVQTYHHPESVAQNWAKLLDSFE